MRLPGRWVDLLELGSIFFTHGHELACLVDSDVARLDHLLREVLGSLRLLRLLLRKLKRLEKNLILHLSVPKFMLLLLLGFLGSLHLGLGAPPFRVRFEHV